MLMLLSMLAVVGTFSLIIVLLGAAWFARRAGRDNAARSFAIAALGVGAVYGLVLIGVSIATPTKILGRSDEFTFQYFDPHLHFRVVDVHREPAADGREQWRVRVRARSDAKRIEIDPSYVNVRLVDADGRSVQPVSVDGRFASSKGRLPGFFPRVLRPGEHYTVELGFQTPAEFRDPALMLTEDSWPNQVLIGNNESLFHRRARIRLAQT